MTNQDFQHSIALEAKAQGIELEKESNIHLCGNCGQQLSSFKTPLQNWLHTLNGVTRCRHCASIHYWSDELSLWLPFESQDYHPQRLATRKGGNEYA
jgi:hypothetical protein